MESETIQADHDDLDSASTTGTTFDTTDGMSNEACGHLTPTRYNKLIGTHDARRAREAALKATPATQAALQVETGASFKTLDLANLHIAMGAYASTHTAVLQAFEQRPGLIKRRFDMYNCKRSVLEKISQDVATLAGPPASGLVAFGDATFGPSFGKGHETGPKKTLVKYLAKRSRCVLADEYCTSQKCSFCEEQCGEERLQRMVHRTPVAVNSHGVLQCKTCYVTWNRDVNAARNIRHVVRAALDAKDSLFRPAYLRRPNVLKTLRATTTTATTPAG